MVNLENFAQKKIINNNRRNSISFDFGSQKKWCSTETCQGIFFYFLGILFETILQNIYIIYLNRNHFPLLILPSGWTLAQGPNAKPWKMH